MRKNDIFIVRYRFMVRCEGKDKKNVRKCMFSNDPSRGKTKEKSYQTRGNFQGRNDYNNDECYYCKKKENIQIICQDIREAFKRVRSLMDYERWDGKPKGEVDLGLLRMMMIMENFLWMKK